MTTSPRTRKRRANTDPAPSAATTLNQPQRNPESDDFDQQVVAQVDFSIWRAVYNGQFRLAVRCDRCGRWLTHGISKRNHLGPRCATKAVEQ